MRKLSLGIGAVAVIAVSIGALSAGAVTSKPLVAVQVDEFSVFPGTQGAPKGKVRFVVTNIGKVEHEFVVLKTNKPAGNLLKGNEADETGAVGEIGGVPPGQARTLNLRLSRGTTRSSATCQATTRPASSPTFTFDRQFGRTRRKGAVMSGASSRATRLSRSGRRSALTGVRPRSTSSSSAWVWMSNWSTVFTIPSRTSPTTTPW